MEVNVYNTIIIGAGPVGSYLADKLALLGYKVLVLDKKTAAGQDVCCTGIISKECLDLLAIDDNLIIRQANSAKFMAPSGKSLRLWRTDDVAYIIDRPNLEPVLVNRAITSGADYVFSTHVTNIHIEAKCLRIHADCNGQQEIFEAETAVIASGFGSALSRKLDLGEINDFTVGAQAEVPINGVAETEIYLDQTLAPGGFAWLVPCKNNKGLAGLMTRQHPERYLNKLLSTLKAQGKVISSESVPGYGAIPLQPLPRTYTDRILVVGEAAGQIKPTTGGGIYYGILCADIAANNLHQAFLTNDFSKSRMAWYQKQWQAKLGKEMQAGYMAHRLYKRLGNRQIEHLCNFAGGSNIPKLVAGLDEFSFDWHRELILHMLKQMATSIPVQIVRNLSRRNTTTNN